MHQPITLYIFLSLCNADVLIHLTLSLILMCFRVFLRIFTYILCKLSFHLHLNTLYITNVVLLLSKLINYTLRELNMF